MAMDPPSPIEVHELALKIDDKVPESAAINAHDQDRAEYRLYKWRFVGCIALCFLNILGGMNWLWFSAIALNTASAFNISISRVNWLGNSVNLIYLPISFLIPWAVRRFGTRKASLAAAAAYLIGAWLRYSATVKTMTTNGAYVTLLLGQLFCGFGQPWPQILAVSYSEAWFGLKARTTATMVIALTNPVGSALAQLLSPIFTSVDKSILALAIITSVLAPFALLIQDKPLTPPTYAGSRETVPVSQAVRSALGCPLPGEEDAAMTRRQRLDFAILTYGFGVTVGVISAFSILINQVYAPYGFNSNQSGLVGGALFISGIVGAVVTAPLFDRVLTHQLGLTMKLALPVVAASWVGLIFAVGSKAGLTPSYVIMCISGFSSFMLLPVALELACEVTSNAEMSSATLWFAANAFTVLFVLVAGDLREAHGSPHGSMKKVLIMFACLAVSVAIAVLALEGRQARRYLDEEAVQLGGPQTSSGELPQSRRTSGALRGFSRAAGEIFVGLTT